jgi:hypothetical protein
MGAEKSVSYIFKSGKQIMKESIAEKAAKRPVSCRLTGQILIS